MAAVSWCRLLERLGTLQRNSFKLAGMCEPQALNKLAFNLSDSQKSCCSSPFESEVLLLTLEDFARRFVHNADDATEVKRTLDFSTCHHSVYQSGGTEKNVM